MVIYNQGKDLRRPFLKNEHGKGVILRKVDQIMRKINSELIEKQGYKLNVSLKEDGKTWKLKTELVLVRVRNGKEERVSIGVYSKKDIKARKYVDGLAEINKLNIDTGKKSKDKEELEKIHEQILKCVEEGTEQIGGDLSIDKAHEYVVDYVKEHDNPGYWWIKDGKCYICYKRVEEILSLADCTGWNKRLEFVNALKLNNYVYTGKGRTEKKATVEKGKQIWALVLKIEEGVYAE